MDKFTEHSEALSAPISELGAEARVDEKAEKVRWFVDRVTTFFGVPEEDLINEKGPRLSEIQAVTMIWLHYQAGLSHDEIADRFQRSRNSVNTHLAKGRRLYHEERWQAHLQELTAEDPPIPLLDQYLGGFCHAYGVTPDMLTESKLKPFLYEPRDGLICRLVTETPIPLKQILKKFNIRSHSPLTKIRRRVAELESEAQARILSIPRADNVPAPSPNPQDIIYEVLEKAPAVSYEALFDRSECRPEVIAVKHHIIRKLYFGTPLQSGEIAPLVGITREAVKQVIFQKQPPENLEESWLSHQERFRRESEKLSAFFGFPVAEYKEGSWPHRILLYDLAEQGVSKRRVAEAVKVSQPSGVRILHQFYERLENDPLFTRLVEAATEGRRLPRDKNFVDMVMAVSALGAGTDVNGLEQQPRAIRGETKKWISYFLRQGAGFPPKEVNRLISRTGHSIVLENVRTISERIASSEEETEKAIFLWRAILNDWPPLTNSSAVLCFPETGNGDLKAIVGRISGEHQGQERQLWVTPQGDPTEEYPMPDNGPTIVDGESARLILKDPRLLEVWLFAKESSEETANQIRETLAEAGADNS